MQARIDSFATLPKDWNYPGDLPPNAETRRLAREIAPFLHFMGAGIESWGVFPCPNGAILFEKGDATIEVECGE